MHNLGPDYYKADVSRYVSELRHLCDDHEVEISTWCDYGYAVDVAYNGHHVRALQPERRDVGQPFLFIPPARVVARLGIAPK